MNVSHLRQIVQDLVAQGKGILAADESTGTITKRFDGVGIESSEETRREYRELLFSTPNIEEFLSGIILFDETIRQSTKEGIPFVKLLADKGIIPGIKVDQGTVGMENSPQEKVTQGLEGLAERLVEYQKMGARFAKWRGIIAIGEELPSKIAISENARIFAKYAALCQEAGIVPIVEPEVLLDGDHTIERSEEVTMRTLKTVFAELEKHQVDLKGMLLKSSMVLAGKDAPQQSSAQEVAAATLRCLQNSVPKTVAGIVFLSGGQSPQQATENLQAIAQKGSQPWQLTFSYSRALQEPALAVWQGKEENTQVAQNALYQRARLNAAAQQGVYDKDMEEHA